MHAPLGYHCSPDSPDRRSFLATLQSPFLFIFNKFSDQPQPCAFADIIYLYPLRKRSALNLPVLQPALLASEWNS